MHLFRLFIYFYLCSVALSCGNSTTPSEDDTSPNNQNSIADSSSTATPVLVRQIQPAAFSYEVQASGRLESLSDYIVMAEAGGFLEKFTAKTGQYLPAGAAIAVFATEATRLKLERAQLQVFNAQKEYESQLLGYEKLFENMNEAQKTDVREKLRISSGLAPALQDIKEAEYELSKAIIKAPFAGIAANVTVRQGEHIKPGTELCRLYNPAQLVLAAKVLESDLPFMQKNLLATVQALGSTQQVNARLYDINPVVDENGMVTVRLMLQSNSSTRFFVGMHARATIQVPAKNTLAVPRDALVYRGGRAVVFTFVNGLAKWNYVTTGLDNGKEVEITEGLNPGDEVIMSNNVQLAHDSPVTKTIGTAEGGKP